MRSCDDGELMNVIIACIGRRQQQVVVAVCSLCLGHRWRRRGAAGKLPAANSDSSIRPELASLRARIWSTPKLPILRVWQFRHFGEICTEYCLDRGNTGRVLSPLQDRMDIGQSQGRSRGRRSRNSNSSLFWREGQTAHKLRTDRAQICPLDRQSVLLPDGRPRSPLDWEISSARADHPKRRQH